MILSDISKVKQPLCFYCGFPTVKLIRKNVHGFIANEITVCIHPICPLNVDTRKIKNWKVDGKKR